MPHATGSLGLVVLAVGGILVLWGTVNFITTLLSAATFAVILFNLYRKLGGFKKGSGTVAGTAGHRPKVGRVLRTKVPDPFLNFLNHAEFFWNPKRT